MGARLQNEIVDDDWSFYVTGTGYQEYLAEYETLAKKRQVITEQMNYLKAKMRANKLLRDFHEDSLKQSGE